MVRATLGADAEVISGAEEAALSFAGAVGNLDPADGPFLVVDVGGGSTELVLGELLPGEDAAGAAAAPAVRLAAAKSVDIGCVRITERCLKSDPPTPDECKAAEELARGVLEAAFDAVPVAKARTWIGLAGTMTQLSSVAQRLPSHDPALVHLSRLSHQQLHAVCAELLAMTHAERAANPTIHPGRVDVIGGGALIVRVLADELLARAGIDELVVSEHDILDGIALSLP
jgi:exopolyphosphatase/guanosine-5'-triphosphate,3'-diphosphate pyrophosphatase